MNNYLLDDVAEYPLALKKFGTYRNIKLWVARWMDALILNKVSNKTLRSYQFALDNFLSFIKRHNRSITPSTIGAKFINRWLIHYQLQLACEKAEKGLLKKYKYELLLKESTRSIGKNDANFTILEEFENTLSQRATVIKMFLQYVTENNKDLHDYTKLFTMLARIKIQDKFTDYLTSKELQTVIEYMANWRYEFKKFKPKSSEINAIRDALMLTLYALTGARSEEVVYIKLKDLKLITKNSEQYYVIKIEKAKGGKKRSVAVKQHYLVLYIEYLISRGMSDECYLSSTYKKGIFTCKPVSADSIRVFSNDTLKYLGINKTGLHAYRRGYVSMRVGEDKVLVSVVAKEVGNTSAILEKHYLKHDAELH